MTFKGHLVGGVIAGVGLAGISIQLGYIPPQDVNRWVGVGATTVFFSLFPDLDTSSVPQRWFFRGVLLLLFYLGWSGHYELATLVGMLSISPLLHRHRGWTHWKISPLIAALVLGATYEYWRARHAWVGGFSWGNVSELLQANTLFMVACIVGWYTHLLLDGRFKFFPTDRDRR